MRGTDRLSVGCRGEGECQGGVRDMKAVEREVEVRMGQQTGGMEEVVGGSRDGWVGGGVGV